MAGPDVHEDQYRAGHEYRAGDCGGDRRQPDPGPARHLLWWLDRLPDCRLHRRLHHYCHRPRSNALEASRMAGRLPAILDGALDTLSVIHFTPHQFQAAPGDAVGLAARRLDRLLGLELAEQQQAALVHQPAVAVEKLDARDLPGLVPEQRDAAALRECMEHPLFVS